MALYILISIHALLAESDLIALFDFPIVPVISIHALLAESDGGSGVGSWPRAIFLSTLSLRRATSTTIITTCIARFLSTLSLRRATVDALELAGAMLFLSTLSLRRATLRVVDGSKSSIISIHALLAESDRETGTLFFLPGDFYPRSPCGERLVFTLLLVSILLFLSTLSLRRATRRHRGNDGCPVHFYPRSPCGERRGIRRYLATREQFLSTLSLRRATDVIAVMTDAQSISIHALLAESDSLILIIRQHSEPFLSTLSLRRATASSQSSAKSTPISIHALLAESD